MSIQNGKSLEEFKYIGDMNVIGISKKKVICVPICRINENRVNFTRKMSKLKSWFSILRRLMMVSRFSRMEGMWEWR